MAISSNRSPSPISNRTPTNPSNPTTPNTNKDIRKSFNGNPLKKQLFVRNSKSFNPITPANSPSDFQQRNSREGISSMRVSCEYKENEKDKNLKLSKLRSPSISKGTKNFMAPTISAVSKITPSPRKKILGERNEVNVSSDFSSEIGSNQDLVSGFQVPPPPKPISSDSFPTENSLFSEKIEPKLKLVSSSHVPSETLDSNMSSAPKSIIRSSIPHSDGNPFPKTKNSHSCLEMEENPSKQDEGSTNPEISSTTQNISESLPEPTSEGFKVKPFSSPSPALAPLDLDPSFPPYDPKTNYLSPRPMFLRYKPNPRIEVYLKKELEFDSGEEGNRVEDSLTSESCSDTDTNEVTQNSDPQQESSDEISEAISEAYDHTHVLENIEKQEEAIGCKEFSRPRSSRSKIASFLLVFVVACLSFSVTDSPIYTNHSTFKDHTFSKLETPAEVVGVGEINSIDLVYNFNLWLAKSTSYLSELSSFSRTVKQMGSSYSVNKTLLDQKILHDHQSEVCLESEKEENHEESEYTSEEKKETEETKDDQTFTGIGVEMDDMDEVIVEEIEEETPMVSQAAEIELEVLEEVESQKEDEHDSHVNIDSTSLVERQEDDSGLESSREEGESEQEDEEEQNILDTHMESIEIQKNNEELHEQSSLISLASESESEMVVELEKFQDNGGIDTHSNTKQPDSEITTHKSEFDDNFPQSSPINDASLENPDFGTFKSIIHELLDMFPKQTTTLLVSLVLLLTLFTGSAFIHMKTRKRTPTPVAEVSVKLLEPKKFVPSATNDSKTPQLERYSSQNWATEEEMLGQSGPSEMSTSFQNSSSCRQRGTETDDEMQSYERNSSINRIRESSSEYSAGSPSYGSFTTYEKIYKKHGNGDEVVTPVRRSSRISKKIVST